MEYRTYLTIRQFCNHYAWPTYNGMRNRCNNKKKNGYESAFLKDGKQVVVDVERFWEILREKQVKKEE